MDVVSINNDISYFACRDLCSISIAPLGNSHEKSDRLDKLRLETSRYHQSTTDTDSQHFQRDCSSRAENHGVDVLAVFDYSVVVDGIRGASMTTNQSKAKISSQPTQRVKPMILVTMAVPIIP